MKTFRHVWIATVAAVTIASSSALNAVEPEAALPQSGINIARTQGGWVNLAVEDHRLKATFFDEKKKPMKPDVTRARARLVHPAQKERSVILNSDGEGALVSPPSIRPPHIFQVFLVLVTDGSSEDPESYSVRFSP